MTSQSTLHPPTDTADTYSDDSSDNGYEERHSRHHILRHKPNLSKYNRSRSHSPRRPTRMSAPTPPSEGGKSLSSHIQEKVLSKVLQTVVPSDYDIQKYAEAEKGAEKCDKMRIRHRPPFSLTLMSGNFRRFNARVGALFLFQHRLFRVLSWQHPTHTLSAIAVYSFICLDPQILAILPVAVIILFVMVPAFIARHPPAPNSDISKGGRIEVYSAHGAPVEPPVEVKAVTELSRDFFRNLMDLQNIMGDFSEIHDQIIATVGPPTNFSNEQISSGVFQLLFAICIGLFIFAYLIPWNLVFLVWGWSTIALFHPVVQEWLFSTPDSKFAEREKEKAVNRFTSWVEWDIVVDEMPEVHEVEIFELQRQNPRGWEWEPWIYSASPYEPLTPARISGQRPKGTRFFEDVRPPIGWEWKDKKWRLDLGSREWVTERCIVGVEVDEGRERWVYDVVEAQESDDEAPGGKRAVRERREWRRRRWVRDVVRKKWGGI